MTTPRTAWIGGSYLAACGLTKPPALKSESIRDYLLAEVARRPGRRYEELAPGGVSLDTVRRWLYKLKDQGLIHNVKIFLPRETSGVAGVSFWYLGKAPAEINHMTKGRPRSVKN